MFNYGWLILRFTAIIVLLGLLIDIEIFILIVGFLFLHINMGLCAIIFDYMHIKKIKYVSLFLIRISAIEMSRYTLEFLL